MVEKNTIICDVCDEHVAKCKCEICNKDICDECLEEIFVGFFESDVPLFNMNTCERCSKQLNHVCLSEATIFQEVFKDKPELKNEIVEAIKNIMMLKKISDEEIIEEEEKTISLTPPIPPNYYPYPNPVKYHPPNPYKPYPNKNPFKYPFRYYSNNKLEDKKKKWWGGIK
jgi:hypothetical protein